jgi:hypothetical protein
VGGERTSLQPVILDPGFGQGGYVLTTAYALLLQQDGKIVLAGEVADGFGSLLAHIDTDQLSRIVPAIDLAVAQNRRRPELPKLLFYLEHVTTGDFLES